VVVASLEGSSADDRSRIPIVVRAIKMVHPTVRTCIRLMPQRSRRNTRMAKGSDTRILGSKYYTCDTNILGLGIKYKVTEWWSRSCKSESGRVDQILEILDKLDHMVAIVRPMEFHLNHERIDTSSVQGWCMRLPWPSSKRVRKQQSKIRHTLGPLSNFCSLGG
jgi:hypothetical protein